MFIFFLFRLYYCSLRLVDTTICFCTRSQNVPADTDVLRSKTELTNLSTLYDYCHYFSVNRSKHLRPFHKKNFILLVVPQSITNENFTLWKVIDTPWKTQTKLLSYSFLIIFLFYQFLIMTHCPVKLFETVT